MPNALIQLLRPRTLPAAAAPVLLALAASYTAHPYHVERQFSCLSALLCLSFALLMQMAANVVNDYVDAKKGRDGADRIGPQRVAATGAMSMGAIRAVAVVLFVLSAAVGLPLAWLGGWWLIGVGALCMLFCVLYSTTLAGRGWGDALVIVFFGLVPVMATYYLQTGTLTWPVALLSLAIGLVTDLLLVVNNYRDIYQDEAHGKVTLVVKLGAGRALQLYLALGVAAVVLAIVALLFMGRFVFSFLPLFYLAQHLVNYQRLIHTPHGPQLNKSLASAAVGIMAFTLITCLALLSARLVELYTIHLLFK